jgi:SAM-dependent methyltransferase
MCRIRLNLGCGVNYLPDYVNIDNNTALVADQYCDVRYLPYSPGSVDEVLASHVLEHFDIFSVPFLLADWISLLKPGGKLIIEVPHLIKAVKYLKSRSTEFLISQNQIRFLYGIDEPGNNHKSGFTPAILKKILKQFAVSQISQVHPVRYTFEGSLRFECIKTDNSRFTSQTFFTRLYRAIWRESSQKSSLYLETLNIEIMSNLRLQYSQKGGAFYSKENIIRLAAKFAIFDPNLILPFLSFIPPSRKAHIYPDRIQTLISENSSMKICNLWILSKKTKFGTHSEYEKFILYWEKRFMQFLTTKRLDPENWSFYEKQLNHNSNFDHFGWNVIQLNSKLAKNQVLKNRSKN